MERVTGRPAAAVPRSVAAHQAAIAEVATALEPRKIPLAEALGCVLAADVTSTTPIPLFDNSAMDGYAVIMADIAEASESNPITLPVSFDIAAGDTNSYQLQAGHVARIMTGAPMPAGAEAVIPVELSDGGTKTVTFAGTVTPGRHIRKAGEDMSAGDLVLASGTVLGPRHLAAVASAGHGTVVAHPRPKVAVIATGSELIEAGQAPSWGQIPDSNSHLLAASVRDAGAELVAVAVVSDSEEEFAATLDQYGAQADVIICSGGVSVGAYDVVKAVLSPIETMWFGPVAMQPGKPQGFGKIPQGALVITLPGNPVSVHVSFEVFVRPALSRMAGLQQDAGPQFVDAMVSRGWKSPAGREQYAPIIFDGLGPGSAPLVRPASAGGSASHLVASLAGAEGLARVPAEAEEVSPGDHVSVIRTTGSR